MPPETVAQRLERISRQVGKASPGPWEPHDDEIYGPNGRGIIHSAYVVQDPDLFFLAAARADVPWLLALVARAGLAEICQCGHHDEEHCSVSCGHYDRPTDSMCNCWEFVSLLALPADHITKEP